MIDNETLELHLKKDSKARAISSLIISVATVCSFGFGFYYQTNFKIEEQSNSIEVLQKDVNEIKEIQNSTNVSNAMSVTEMKNVQTNLDRVDATVIRLEEKVDKMLIIAKKLDEK